MDRLVDLFNSEVAASILYHPVTVERIAPDLKSVVPPGRNQVPHLQVGLNPSRSIVLLTTHCVFEALLNTEVTEGIADIIIRE